MHIIVSLSKRSAVGQLKSTRLEIEGCRGTLFILEQDTLSSG